VVGGGSAASSFRGKGVRDRKQHSPTSIFLIQEHCGAGVSKKKLQRRSDQTRKLSMAESLKGIKHQPGTPQLSQRERTLAEKSIVAEESPKTILKISSTRGGGIFTYRRGDVCLSVDHCERDN